MLSSIVRYLIVNLNDRYPRQWLSGPRRCSNPLTKAGGVEKELTDLGIVLTRAQIDRLREIPTLMELTRRYFFRGVVLDSHEGLVGWLEERYPLVMRPDIPTPEEMLAIQCEGRRFATFMQRPEQQDVRYGRHANACDFLLHDLEHAHKFFGDEVLHRGQVRFFRTLQSGIEAFAAWNADPVFKKDLDYLKADMNSHPVHLMKYLKAVVLNAEMRRTGDRYPDLENFWQSVFGEWKMDPQTLTAALRLNQPALEQPKDLVQLSRFFTASREIPCGNQTLEAR